MLSLHCQRSDLEISKLRVGSWFTESTQAGMSPFEFLFAERLITQKICSTESHRKRAVDSFLTHRLEVEYQTNRSNSQFLLSNLLLV